MSKLIIAEKPSVAKSIASPWVLHPGPMAFMRQRPSRILVRGTPGIPRWMLAAMTSVSRNGAMTISHSAGAVPLCAGIG